MAKPPLAVAACLLATVCAATSAQQPAKPPPVKAIVKAAGAFVQEFEKKLAFALADEDYTQLVLDEHFQPLDQRSIHGELFLTYLVTDHDWIAVHDVEEVDGQPVPDHETLQDLLRLGALESIGNEIAAHNAKFNIGSIPRNFNEPTLALLVVESQRVGNFDFSLKSQTVDQGAAVVALEFSEKGSSTLVRAGRARQPAPSKGEFLIEPETGRIHRTRFSLDVGGTTAMLTTFYSPDEKIETWVPTLFTERYEQTKNGPHQIIQCQARYTNYRIFQALGRVKK